MVQPCNLGDQFTDHKNECINQQTMQHGQIPGNGVRILPPPNHPLRLYTTVEINLTYPHQKIRLQQRLSKNRTKQKSRYSNHSCD